MSRKSEPLFRFSEDGKASTVTWYTRNELKEVLAKEKQGKNKVNDVPSESEQRKMYKEIVNLIYKECTTKTNKYIGLELDNIYYEENPENPEDTMMLVMFDRILVEMEVMSDHGHEYVQDKYDTDQPFTSEYAVKQFIKRLGKFVIKHANTYLNEEDAKHYIEEAKSYLN